MIALLMEGSISPQRSPRLEPTTIDPAASEAERDLLRRVLNLLYARGIRSVRDLRIEVCGGCVTLEGAARDAHEHWRCIECCRHVAGVTRLVDRLRVAET